MKQGTKFDTGKLPIHLIPAEAIDALAERLMIGAEKYGEYNWTTGIKFSRLFSAAMRHAWAYWRGEDVDKDSGLCHLSGVLINIAFLIAFTRRDRKDLDDRPSNQTMSLVREPESKSRISWWGFLERWLRLLWSKRTRDRKPVLCSVQVEQATQNRHRQVN